MPIFCNNCGGKNRDNSKFCYSCGSPLETLLSNEPLAIGMLLENRYKIIKIVKTEKFINTYEIIDDKLDSRFYLKELFPNYSSQEQEIRGIENFRKEAKFLAKLEHPNLCRIIDYFVSNDRNYVIMNYVDGDDLEMLLKKEGEPGLPDDKVIEWSTQILELVDFLQRQNPPVVYNNIRPSTIVIRKDGKPILMEFGVSRLFQDTQNVKNDIYTMGATMYHLLTGINPISSKFSPLIKILPKISPVVDNVVMRALTETIMDRFSNPWEMLKTLAPKKERTIVTEGSGDYQGPSSGYASQLHFIRPEDQPENKSSFSTQPLRDEFVMQSLQSDYATQPLKSDFATQHLRHEFETKPLSFSFEQAGRKLWEFKAGDEIYSSPCIAEGLVYVGSFDEKLYCLDAKDGKKIWEFDAGNWIISSPCIVANLVYFGSDNDKFYCLDSKTGKKVWEYETSDWVRSSPCYMGGMIYCGSYDGKLYCFDANNGRMIWAAQTDNIIYSSPCAQDSCIYFGSNDSKFYCLNARDGSVIWVFPTGGEIKSSPYIHEGRIYFGSKDEKLYCLDAKTGAKYWEFKTGGGFFVGGIYSSPIVVDGFIYFGSDDSKLYCLNMEGSKMWEFETGGSVRTSPCVLGDSVYFGSDDSKLYCLDIKDGKRVWEFETSREVRSSPCIVDGDIYFGSSDNKVYCLDTNKGLLTSGNSISGHEYRKK